MNFEERHRAFAEWQKRILEGKFPDVEREIQGIFLQMDMVRRKQIEIGRLQCELDEMPFIEAYEETSRDESKKESGSSEANLASNVGSSAVPNISQPSTSGTNPEKKGSTMSVSMSPADRQAELQAEKMEQSFSHTHETMLHRKEHVNKITARLQELGQQVMQLKEMDMITMSFQKSDEQTESNQEDND
jgi:hypothetical protein